jgi:hypothetical protein
MRIIPIESEMIPGPNGSKKIKDNFEGYFYQYPGLLTWGIPLNPANL